MKSTSSSVAPNNFTSRCVGATMGGMIGDAIGAGVEGESHKTIMQRFPGGSYELYSSTHMGAYHLPPRFGHYTDDTNSALAIMSSICKLNGRLNMHDVAYRHARHYFDGVSMPVYRGYPGSAQQMMRMTINGKTPRECATVAFSDGSYANGAAMKAFPVGLAFQRSHRTDPGLFEKAVGASCAYSHVHPLGVDAGLVQAKGVAMAAEMDSWPFDVSKFLTELEATSQTQEIKSLLRKMKEELKAAGPMELPVVDATSLEGCSFVKDGAWQRAFQKEVGIQFDIASKLVGSNNMKFQIDGPSAIVCALLPFLRLQGRVNDAIAVAIALGGDTDTIASMAGSMSGALVGGHDWVLPEVWNGLDNSDRGRDWAVALAEKLATIVEKSETLTVDEESVPMPPKTGVDKAWEMCNGYLESKMKSVHVNGGLHKDVVGFDDLLSMVFHHGLAEGQKNATTVPVQDCFDIAGALSGPKGSAPRDAVDSKLAALQEKSDTIDETAFMSLFL